MSGAPDWNGSGNSLEGRSKPEYSFPPPNPKYAESAEYRQAPRYTPPPASSYTRPTYYAPQPQTNYQAPAYGYAGTNLLLRFAWFVFIGWWLGFLWLLAGYGLCSTIIGLPLGLYMLNRTPYIMTLRPASARVITYGPYGAVAYGPMQYSFWIRAIYYFFVGSWAGMVWTILAYLLCLPIITLPVSMLMFDKLPVIMTLRRN